MSSSPTFIIFDFCSFPAGVMRAGFLSSTSQFPRQHVLLCTLLRDHRTKMLKMGASCSGSLALTCFTLFLLFERCILFSVVCLVVSHCEGTCACDCMSLQRPGEGQDPQGLESQALLSCPTRALTAQFQSSAGAARLLITSTSFTLKERKSLPVQWSFPGSGEEGSRTRTPTHTGTCITTT